LKRKDPPQPSLFREGAITSKTNKAPPFGRTGVGFSPTLKGGVRVSVFFLTQIKLKDTDSHARFSKNRVII